MLSEKPALTVKAYEAREQAQANAELKRAQRQKRVNQLIREKINPAIDDAVEKGQAFLIMTVGHEAIGVLDDLYQILLDAGYDICENVENQSDKFGNEYFEISWKNAQEGRQGIIIQSKNGNAEQKAESR